MVKANHALSNSALDALSTLSSMQAESSLMSQRPSWGCLRMWALGDRVAGAQVFAATGQAGWLAGNSRWRCRQWLARPSLLSPFLVALMHIQYSVLLILSMIFHYPNFLTRAKKNGNDWKIHWLFFLDFFNCDVYQDSLWFHRHLSVACAYPNSSQKS